MCLNFFKIQVKLKFFFIDIIKIINYYFKKNTGDQRKWQDKGSIFTEIIFKFNKYF